MIYDIRLSMRAREDFAFLPAYHRGVVRDAIANQLQYEPTRPTRKRKPLDINPVATWELRVGDWPILYDVNEEDRIVNVVAIGRKVHDKLVIRGQEWNL